MSDHFPRASASQGRRKWWRGAVGPTAERYLRSRLRRLLVMLALAVALIVGSAAAVTALVDGARAVWPATATTVTVLCVAFFMMTGRRMLAEADAESREYDEYVAGVNAQLRDMENLVARSWYDIAGLLEKLSPPPPPPPPQAWPEAEAVEFANRFSRLSHVVTRGRDETLASLAHVIAAQNRTSSPEQSEQVEVFVYIARRLHSLVNRALKQLSELEKSVEDPTLFHDLLGVDHLVTQVRRQVENIAVLGGAVPRRINTPVPLSTILRVTGAEIEEYPRLRPILSGEERAIPGYAAVHVIHLLAELAENATKFSEGQVLLRAQLVPAGLAFEIEDRGLHMSAEKLARMNRLLEAPDEVDLGEQLRTGQIGLLVCARIAQRLSIMVTLRPNVLGGTDALVVLPSTLLTTPAKVNLAPPVPAPPAVAAPLPPERPAAPSTAVVGHALPQRRRHVSAAPAPEPVPAQDGKPPLPRRSDAPQEPEPIPVEAEDAPAPATPGLMAAFAAGVARSGTPPVPRPDDTEN